MPTENICTVVASRPGVMMESLRGTLSGIPGVEVAGSSGDGLSTLNLIRELEPDLLVIDCNLLEEETIALLSQVKEKYSHVCCMVLTQTRQQHVIAVDAGADVVLSRNLPARELSRAVIRIRSSLERERGFSTTNESRRNYS